MLKITREQFYNFIKTAQDTPDALTPATQHYLQYFDQYQSTGKKSKWNWGASSFVGLWLLYRKMYLYGLIAILCEWILKRTLPVGTWGNLIDITIDLSIGFGIGFYGNYIYLQYATKKIAAGQKEGGVDCWAVGLAILLSLMLWLFSWLYTTYWVGKAH